MKRSVLALAGALVVTAPAIAHHGWGNYETTLVTISGAVVKSRYENPHATISVHTPEKQWTVMLAPTSRMTSRGVSADMVAVGRSVIVQGYISKSDKNEMRAERITVNGKTFEMR